MTPRSGQLHGRVVVFGEVLFDVFPEGEEVLGGAPFNVAWHLTGFGVDPLLISRVGSDRRGERVREAMAEWKMDTRGLQVDPERPTGRVEVGFDDGQPRFEIARDQAWDRIEAPPASAVGEDPVALIYQGTLIERSESSRDALVELKRTTGGPVFLDLNLRPPWWRHAVAEEALARARWGKLNREELDQIRREPVGGRPEDLALAARRTRERWELDLLVVTRAEHGALLATPSGLYRHAPRPLGGGLVDTVGAGDGFSAVVILGLLRGWSPETMLERGVGFASEICRRRGATPREPELYRRRLQDWS